MNNPILQFDFNIQHKEEDSLLFTEPIDIIQTWDYQDVEKQLFNVKRALQQGYYAAGFISYEATYAFFSSKQNISPKIPLLWFGIFKAPSVREKRPLQRFSLSPWKISETKEAYQKKINYILDQIKKKKIEQINYTVPFTADFSGDTFAYYEQLKSAQQSDFSAYLDIGEYQILSVSPELFFHMQDQQVTVKPMKGTIHRGKTYEEDIQLKTWLQNSKKNIIENNLITNLMKEELTNVSVPNTVEVIDPCKVDPYPTVYQMTSTIKSNVLPNLTAIDVLRTLFPCGSISGVPKKETIDLIANIERESRGIYCGAIGYMTPFDKAIFNVPIRTVTIHQESGIATYGAGGAITQNSSAEEEYQEMVTKTRVLERKTEEFQLLETFGLYNGEFVVFNEHLRRLSQSATYFNFRIDKEAVKEQLHQVAETYSKGSWRVRLVIDEKGKSTLDVQPLHETKGIQSVGLATKPINKEDLFLYHKTTKRGMYQQFKQNREQYFDVLLYNDQEEITEFTIGNVVVHLDGELLTPPISSGVLPGTYRERLLQEGKIKERKIWLHQLKKAHKIWLINSVRKWVEVKLQK